MRYAIVSKGLTIAELEAEAKKAGAREIREAGYVGELFCELDEEQAKRLSALPGLAVKRLREFRTDQVPAAAPVETFTDVFHLLRSYFTPPLTGTGLTVAVLDSGIRGTHQSLTGKVVHEDNFTDSPTAGDVFGHGTQVAYVAAGGLHGGERAGVSPGASLMNTKVINDQGFGTDESVVAGIDRVCGLAVKARENGLWPTDDAYPNILNLSLGAEDDGDPDNPVRAACRRASVDYGLDVVAAAGNYGPRMTTVTVPACDPETIAVGAVMTFGDLTVWEKSSRGPTARGDTKPDFVLWGTDLEMASHRDDEGYLTKSGTSFAAPMLSGLAGLLWESGRRAYGGLWRFRWTEAREFALYFCTKPPNAALKKDNAYGFGLPAVGAMLGAMETARRPEEEMMAMLPMMIMLGMMRGVVV